VLANAYCKYCPYTIVGFDTYMLPNNLVFLMRLLNYGAGFTHVVINGYFNDIKFLIFIPYLFYHFLILVFINF
jgi:hypothetical protein